MIGRLLEAGPFFLLGIYMFGIVIIGDRDRARQQQRNQRGRGRK